MELVLVAVLALASAIFGPVLLNQMNRREDDRKARLVAEHEERAIVAREEHESRMVEARREERKEDWARQDLMAEKAAAVAAGAASAAAAAAAKASEAAGLLVDAQGESIARTDEVARLAAKDTQLVHKQLNEIHRLVNSDMTAARQELLTQTKLVLAMYKRTIAADIQAGLTPKDSDLAAVKIIEGKVEEQEIILTDRLAKQAVLDQQAVTPEQDG